MTAFPLVHLWTTGRPGWRVACSAWIGRYGMEQRSTAAEVGRIASGPGITPPPKNQKKRPQRGEELRPFCGSVMGADTIPQCAATKTVPADNLDQAGFSDSSDRLCVGCLNPSP